MSEGPTAFGTRLADTMAERGPLCVGIDPHASLLRDWSLTDDAHGVREFGLRVVEAACPTVGIVKPQVAFFERHGSAGYQALEAVLAAARDAGLLVIADVKRGDLGTTMAGYADAWLTPGSPLEADAMTATAFMGLGALEPAISLADAHGKGVFVLAATSNPEAAQTQQATLTAGRWAGATLAAGIVGEVAELNAEEVEVKGGTLGSLGVVLGATLDLADFGIDLDSLRHTPILAPGFGFQGAALDQVGELYGSAADGVIVASSRAVLAAGPDGIAAEITRQAQEVNAWRR